jgi:hypothetical protein
MSTIIKFVAPADLLFPPAQRESALAGPESKPIRLGSIRTPEERFWKLPGQALPSQFGLIELFVLVLFVVVAVSGVVSCFGELSNLLGSDAIGHVVMRVISGRG